MLHFPLVPLRGRADTSVLTRRMAGFIRPQLQPRHHTVEHAGSHRQRLHVCVPFLPLHTHLYLTYHPRFAGATAWLAAYTRDPVSDSEDGPPSLWSYNLSQVLEAAAVKCAEEEPTGNCTCVGTSCSDDPRFRGPIGGWNVSGVTDMVQLFNTDGSSACTTYCEFDGDISAWDVSSVTNMYGMCVRRRERAGTQHSWLNTISAQVLDGAEFCRQPRNMGHIQCRGCDGNVRAACAFMPMLECCCRSSKALGADALCLAGSTAPPSTTGTSRGGTPQA